MYTGLIAGVFIAFFILAILDKTIVLRDHEGSPNSVPFIQLFATLLATAVGGGMIFGLIGFGQSYGTIGILLGFIYCASFITLGFLSKYVRLFVQRMIDEGVIENGETASVPLILAKKYNKTTWGLISITYALIYTGFLAAQYIAITKIISAMGLAYDESWLITISALLVLIYISIGGYCAVLRTDLFQLLIIGLLFLIGVLLFFSEGFHDFNKLPSSYWNPFSNGTILSYFVWLSIFVFPSILLRLDHWQRIVTAENDIVARNAYITAGIFLFLVFLVLLTVGAYSAIHGNSDPFWIYRNNLFSRNSFFLSLVFGIAFTAFLAAIISSADTLLNTISAFLVQTGKAWGIVGNNSSLPAIIVNIVITALSLVLALKVRNIVPLIVEGFKAVTILLPSIVAALLYKNPSSMAATVSVGSGLLAYVLIMLLWSNASNWAYVFSFIISTCSSLLTHRLEIILKNIRLKEYRGEIPFPPGPDQDRCRPGS